ncbi:hypothetical protein M5D96_002650 [Drosophila gunungcola]|uniref:Uncharacterized protein n=1 Tax=Drosophila gunungcola TaxID=103775 RepID=A0A9Q0BVP5_9MUSC|nr:hypothetical protein M5D96_002650 [Drosophila gunungcola]
MASSSFVRHRLPLGRESKDSDSGFQAAKQPAKQPASCIVRTHTVALGTGPAPVRIAPGRGPVFVRSANTANYNCSTMNTMALNYYVERSDYECYGSHRPTGHCSSRSSSMSTSSEDSLMQPFARQSKKFRCVYPKCNIVEPDQNKIIRHIRKTHLGSRVLLDEISVPSMCKSMVTSYDCRRLASSSTRPVSVWPCLMKMGMGSRQRTWYQCVSGAVGDVESHTFWLLPLNSTSNQKASPSSSLSLRKSHTCRTDLAMQMRMSKVSTMGWRKYSFMPSLCSVVRSTPWKADWYQNSADDDCENEEEFYYTDVDDDDEQVKPSLASEPTLSHRDMARPPHEDPEYQKQIVGNFKWVSLQSMMQGRAGSHYNHLAQPHGRTISGGKIPSTHQQQLQNNNTSCIPTSHLDHHNYTSYSISFAGTGLAAASASGPPLGKHARSSNTISNRPVRIRSVATSVIVAPITCTATSTTTPTQTEEQAGEEMEEDLEDQEEEERQQQQQEALEDQEEAQVAAANGLLAWSRAAASQQQAQAVLMQG